MTVPPEVHADLEDELRAAYALRDVVVVDDDSLPALGAADRRLSGRHGGAARIGIASWSATLMAAADAMSAPVASQAEEVTQLVGGIGDPAVQFRATGLTARLAELTGARAVRLPARGLLRSVALRDALVLDRGRGRDGRLGRADAGAGRHRRTRAVRVGSSRAATRSAPQSWATCAQGARSATSAFASSTRRAARWTRRSTPACSASRPSGPRDRAPDRRRGRPQKYPAVRAAVRGGWINVLITDAASAQRLAEERP